MKLNQLEIGQYWKLGQHVYQVFALNANDEIGVEAKDKQKYRLTIKDFDMAYQVAGFDDWGTVTPIK